MHLLNRNCKLARGETHPFPIFRVKVLRTLIVLLNILEEQNNFKWKVNKSTFIVLGKFSGQGAKGLMTSDADRSAIVDKAARAAGAKMISYHITRGIYDFWILIEAESFDQIAAINLKAKSADTIDKADVLETVDINSIRKKAKQVNYIPPTE